MEPMAADTPPEAAEQEEEPEDDASEDEEEEEVQGILTSHSSHSTILTLVDILHHPLLAALAVPCCGLSFVITD